MFWFAPVRGGGVVTHMEQEVLAARVAREWQGPVRCLVGPINTNSLGRGHKNRRVKIYLVIGVQPEVSTVLEVEVRQKGVGDSFGGGNIVKVQGHGRGGRGEKGRSVRRGEVEEVGEEGIGIIRGRGPRGEEARSSTVKSIANLASRRGAGSFDPPID